MTVKLSYTWRLESLLMASSLSVKKYIDKQVVVRKHCIKVKQLEVFLLCFIGSSHSEF